MSQAKCSKTKVCVKCGKTFEVTTNASKYCDCCRRAATTEKHRELMQKYRRSDRKRLKSLEEINRAAIDLGMSYGKYVSLMGL